MALTQSDFESAALNTFPGSLSGSLGGANFNASINDGAYGIATTSTAYTSITNAQGVTGGKSVVMGSGLSSCIWGKQFDGATSINTWWARIYIRPTSTFNHNTSLAGGFSDGFGFGSWVGIDNANTLWVKNAGAIDTVSPFASNSTQPYGSIGTPWLAPAPLAINTWHRLEAEFTYNSTRLKVWSGAGVNNVSSPTYDSGDVATIQTFNIPNKLVGPYCFTYGSVKSFLPTDGYLYVDGVGLSDTGFLGPYVEEPPTGSSFAGMIPI
jgi:hypothetical protein